MPQEFNTLKCFSCSMFQVHQVKKASAWRCKMCGMKQSLRKIYGKGSGKECRVQVQDLNMKKAQAEEDDVENASETDRQEDSGKCDNRSEKPKAGGKWEAFKTGLTKHEECLDASDEELNSEMSKYDVVHVRESATLDRGDWSGCKERKYGPRAAKSSAHSKRRKVDEPPENNKENRVFCTTPAEPARIRQDAGARLDGSAAVVGEKAEFGDHKPVSKWGNFAFNKNVSSDESD